jgi:hypothetical protein
METNDTDFVLMLWDFKQSKKRETLAVCAGELSMISGIVDALEGKHRWIPADLRSGLTRLCNQFLNESDCRLYSFENEKHEFFMHRRDGLRAKATAETLGFSRKRDREWGDKKVFIVKNRDGSGAITVPSSSAISRDFVLMCFNYLMGSNIKGSAFFASKSPREITAEQWRIIQSEVGEGGRKFEWLPINREEVQHA